MAEYQPFPVPETKTFSKPDSVSVPEPELIPAQIEPPFLPYWARCRVQYAQNLLASSSEPIEYDHDDEDYHDNCFFFPEDCSWTLPKDSLVEAHCHNLRERSEIRAEALPGTGQVSTANMIPGLPDIKMLDSEALGDLLEDNLSPPEITTILVFATNGAVFAYGSSLSSRQLRNLSATYGAAYTCYAKNASSGNLTGVNPASHPSSYVTAQSMSLGDVGSIVFELDDSVAVVTRIADKVLLAAVGPNKTEHQQQPVNGADEEQLGDGPGTPVDENGAILDGSQGDSQRTTGSIGTSSPAPNGNGNGSGNGSTQAGQDEIDRSADLARLASLNLSASPSVLLALESKCAALGKFLASRLEGLDSPEDF